MTLNARKAITIKKLQHVNEEWLLKAIEKLLSDMPTEEVKTADDAQLPGISMAPV